jgi:hypothetical protein
VVAGTCAFGQVRTLHMPLLCLRQLCTAQAIVNLRAHGARAPHADACPPLLGRAHAAAACRRSGRCSRCVLVGCVVRVCCVLYTLVRPAFTVEAYLVKFVVVRTLYCTDRAAGTVSPLQVRAGYCVACSGPVVDVSGGCSAPSCLRYTTSHRKTGSELYVFMCVPVMLGGGRI